MIKRLRIIPWIIALLLSNNILNASPFSFSGYYKNFFVVFQQPEFPALFSQGNTGDRTLGAVNKRVRLQAYFKPSDWFTLHGAYDLSFRIQARSLFVNSPFLTGINPLEYRVADLDEQLYPREAKIPESFGIFQNLDRIFVKFSPAFGDIYLGRQAIAWGSARVINPTDVIAPFTFSELDKEERLGVDALRMRIPIGMLGEFDTGYVFGEDFKFSKSAFFVRTKLYKWKSDISFLAIGFRENLLAGFDVASSVGGAGWWLESAYVFADALKEQKSPNAENYFRLSAGLDYSFSGKTYGFIEYHFNGAGASQPDDYLREFTKTAYQDGAVYLMGRHYLIPGVTYQLTPLIVLSGEMLFNLTDPSLYLAPQIEYNISENIYIGGGSYLGIGKSPKGFELQSEFGSYPNTYFTSFRIYF